MIRWFFWTLSFIRIINATYLSNTESFVNYTHIPTTNFLNKDSSNSNPAVAFGCSVSDSKQNLYLISSTYQYPSRYLHNEQEKCDRTKKYVEIVKYNKNTMNFSETILIGENTPVFSNAVGDKGSDNIVSCGYDKIANIIYYVASNYYNCPSSYKLDSSIVRIDSKTFKFIDRTILRNIPNVPTFSKYVYYNYRYIDTPTTSEIIDGDSLWLGFGTYSTGIWKLNITTTTIKLLGSFRKKYEITENMIGAQTRMVTEKYLMEIKKSFKNEKMVYFVEDTGQDDAMVLSINTSLQLNDNNTMLHKLEGINYISVIKTNLKTGKIYIISGSLTSEMYQYDFNFNKLMLNEVCNIDFLKFPTEWGVITGMEVDYKTGYLYPFISNRYDFNGVVRIDMKDLTIDIESHKKFSEMITYTYNNIEHSYLTYYSKYNISHIDLDIGKIFLIASNGGGNGKVMINIELYGCSRGKGISNKTCEDCSIGKFTNVIGGRCMVCATGYASSDIGSSNCKKCDRGKFSDGVNTAFCANCPTGKYSESTGSSECLNCDKGTFSIVSASHSLKNCISCEPGKISDDGATFCEFCQIGEWARNNKKCMKCPKGKYSDIIGIISNNECKDCLIGFYNEERGRININQCKSCPDGEIGLIGGATSIAICQKCEAGKYKLTTNQCGTCLSGSVSKKNSSTCSICQRGKYPNLYKDTCISCPLGKFNEFDGISSVESCISCFTGTFSNILNLIKPTDCKKCSVGKYNENIGSISVDSCIECIKGKFNDKPGNDVCEYCRPGFFSYTGSLQCEICPLGKYSVIEGLEKFTKCVSCPPGTYADFEGAVSMENCIPCPTGSWNNKEGSQKKDDCTLCLPGLYGIKEKSITNEDCILCAAGKYGKYDGQDSEENCLLCEVGKYSNIGSLKCIDCQLGTFSSKMGVILCEDCEEGKYSDEKSSILCKECGSNSEPELDRKKCECKKGSYRQEDNCILCPAEYICNKGVTIKNMTLKKNYWRVSNAVIKTYQCRNTRACNGGIIMNHTDNLCSDGHRGPLCDICEIGWAKDDGVCLKCPENIERTLSLTIVIPVVCILIIIFLIKTANPSNNKKEEINGVVKIFMNYAQVFSLASSFQINWPTLIRYLFERAKEFSSPRVSFYSSDCAIGWSYYDKLIVYLTLPILYILVVTIVIAILTYCFTRRQKMKLLKIKSIREKKIYKLKHPSCIQFFIAWEKTAIVVGTFLSWPTIVEKTLEVLNCEEIGNNYYLIKDMSVECYTPKHYLFLIIAYVALGIYGLGIPYTGFRLLYKYRYRLFDMQNRYDGSTPLSFLFLGYREKRWYYEFIIMGKKAGLILLSVFLRNYPRYQIIGASLLVQISFFLHVFLRPYDTITSYGIICNKLESISLLSLVMTLSTGLFFGTVDSGYQLGLFENVLIILLILSNGGVTLYFLVYFVTLTWKTVKSHLRTHFQNKFEDDEIPCLLRCCNSKRLENIKEWSFLELTDNYGIHLRTDLEKHIFTNYFVEKQTKLNILNSKIDNIGKKKLSIKLDKIRSEIQAMEKYRCWQTIQNNRLYSTLKKLVMINKSKLNECDVNKLEEVFNLYIQHGIDYNTKMDDLYMVELSGMLQEPMVTNPLSSHNIMENIIIINESDTINQIII
jgi:hypothetical protein